MSVARESALSRAPPALALSPVTIVATAILGLAAAMQVHFGAFGDISWLITVCEGWLDGKTPYVDLIETNPPPAILLYLPATALARALHVKPEATVAAFGLLVAVASAAGTGTLLKGAGLLPRRAPIFGLMTLVALALLPGRTFDERDCFAIAFGLPFVALAAARAVGAPVSLQAALAAGAGAGLMVALKAPYGAIPALLWIFVAIRRGLWDALRLPEAYAAAAVFAALAAISWTFFPAYFRDVVPTVTSAYLPVRESLPTLIANVGVVATLTLSGLAVAASSDARPDAAATSFLIAALGAAIAFFAQGKGWLYHAYPMLALAVIAFAAAIEKRPRDWPALVTAAALAALTYAGAALLNLPPLPTALLGAVAGWVALSRLSPEAGRERLVALAGGGLTGAACGFYALSFPGPSPAFTQAMVSYSEHPSIASIGEGLGLGFPLTRNIGGEWTMRLQGMLMTAGARRLIDQNPNDETLKALLAPIIAEDRDRVAEDISMRRPDVLLVSRHGPRFYAWAMADPKLAAARAPYRFVMSNPDPDWPVDLYVRDDLIGLRHGS